MGPSNISPTHIAAFLIVDLTFAAVLYAVAAVVERREQGASSKRPRGILYHIAGFMLVAVLLAPFIWIGRGG